jgi:OmpA-OmpF porin, OOP family
VVAAAVVLSGCATFRDRKWGTCAVAGAVIGATVGGVTGGVAVNNAKDNATDGERGAAIGGGIVGGALIGGILGHAICDPIKEAPPPPPVAEAPPPPPPPPAPGTKMVELRGPQFDFNKSTLKPEGKRKVDEAVKMMKENPSLNVSVEGHTDSVGSDAYNQKLSERRAQVVSDYLVAEGISASRISTRGWGKSKPVASNKTADGRAQNRRVEIIAQ